MKLTFVPLTIAIQMSIANATTTGILDENDVAAEKLETIHECRETALKVFNEVVQDCIFAENITECFAGHREDYEE